jgi:hypothetical protein
MVPRRIESASLPLEPRIACPREAVDERLGDVSGEPFSTVLLAKVGMAMVLMWAGRTLETV